MQHPPFTSTSPARSKPLAARTAGIVLASALALTGCTPHLGAIVGASPDAAAEADVTAPSTDARETPEAGTSGTTPDATTAAPDTAPEKSQAKEKPAAKASPATTKPAASAPAPAAAAPAAVDQAAADQADAAAATAPTTESPAEDEAGTATAESADTAAKGTADSGSEASLVADDDQAGVGSLGTIDRGVDDGVKRTLPVEPIEPVDPPAVEDSGARSALVTGTYQPSETTAGSVAGTSLTPYNTGGADLVITQDGTVLENLEIYGDIKVRAKNVVIRNSVLHGGSHAPGNATGIVDATSAEVSNLVIEDSTIKPDRPHHFRDGIVGHDYTAKRNHISHTNDGLGIFNRPGGSPAANVLAEGNYIHTLTYFDWSPSHSDGTHNDGIQVQGGENIRIVGNNIDASSVAGAGSSNGPRVPHAGIAIMLQQNVAKLANVVVENNWVDNGQTSINIDNGKYPNITVTVRENLLGRNQQDYGNGSKYPVRIIERSASTVNGLSTNQWADTGEALREGKDLGIRYNG